MKYISIFATLVALAGCGSTISISSDEARAQGKGFLVGSLSTDRPGNIATQQINIYFDPAGGTKLGRVGATVYDHCDPQALSATEFNDTCGRVFTFLLPAGEYVLSSWNITDIAGIIGPRDWRPAKVTVQAGKITYVGNIHMVFNRNLEGPTPIEWRGWPVAVDAHGRDFDVFLRSHPLLAQTEVIMDIPSLDPPGQLCSMGDPNRRSNTICD